MFEIIDLHTQHHDKEILKGVSLNIKPGEVHAIMGPNGSGKSTFAKVTAGDKDHSITSGSLLFEGQDLSTLSPEERACLGIFIGFQYPVSIPGVANAYFLKTAFNALRKARGESELDAADFRNLVKEKMATLKMNEELLYRPVNDGFSGGEKKRNEILQMMLLEPKLAILDETDSGLDIDALQVISQGINAMRSKDRAIVLITHYQRLLDYIVPDYVHVLAKGKIIKSGGKEMALELERDGYSKILGEA